ncbi:MAG TPA: hypothetical protein VNU47_02235 [Candidatus Paceibacterota bacterium]|nr:hypothetical protein [Candidatus Paceibacterota bacterium]
MRESAKALKELAGSGEVVVVCANIPRAIESARIITTELEIKDPTPSSRLYAAEEEGLLPDPAGAYEFLKAVGDSTDFIIAVVSREYVDVLPEYLSTNGITDPRVLETKHLARGEMLVLNLRSGTQS